MKTIPKLAVPLRFAGSGLATVEQDSADERAACVYAIVATERGSRIEEPTFGVEDPTFEALPLDLAEWLAQIALFEPRAEVTTQQDIERELVLVGVAE